jgi:NTP pyrophosphatase (non-canonical NTP hydrolase)
VTLPVPAAEPAEAAEPAGLGAQLVRAVEIMDRLRSPGGCPWDAEQTHSSLAPYLIEEAYETLEAIETADLVALREELGDLLLQVLFHARLAEEGPADQRFTIDDVAGDLVAKLVRRHPHVFADVDADTAEQVADNWDAIKKAEKRRSSATDGVPLGQPALALAAKLVSRSSRAGLAVPLPDGDGIGERLLAVVADAVQAGIDPEQALRTTARAYRDRVRALESSGVDGSDGERTDREAIDGATGE